jgi:hypothetical protein
MGACNRRLNERGATAVLVGILLAVLAAFLALVINVGHGYLVRNELQNATDSAALAAARDLNGTIAGLAAARDDAVDYAGRHETDYGQSVKVDRTLDVEFGNWDPKKLRAEAYRPITGTSASDLRWINAVRVQAGREATRGNAMPVAAGPLLGKNTLDVATSSIAVLGGPCKAACAIPIAFASCVLLNDDGSFKSCDQTFVFNSDTVDNIGFTNLAESPTVSTDVLKDILSGKCSSVGVGDPVGVSNGANLSPLVDLFQAIAALGEEVSAPVVTLGECPAKFNEHGTAATVIGFVKLKVIEAVGGADKHLTLEIKCGTLTDEVEGGGCELFGATPENASLVR